MSEKKQTRTTDRDTELGKKMRFFRRMQGLSQKQLAQELGLSFQQIQKYEAGTNRISAAKLEQMSAVLGIPLSYFFEQSLEDSEYLDILQDKSVVKLARLYTKISSKRLRNLLLHNAKVLSQENNN